MTLLRLLMMTSFECYRQKVLLLCDAVLCFAEGSSNYKRYGGAELSPSHSKLEKRTKSLRFHEFRSVIGLEFYHFGLCPSKVTQKGTRICIIVICARMAGIEKRSRFHG